MQTRTPFALLFLSALYVGCGSSSPSGAAPGATAGGGPPPDVVLDHLQLGGGHLAVSIQKYERLPMSEQRAIGVAASWLAWLRGKIESIGASPLHGR